MVLLVWGKMTDDYITVMRELSVILLKQIYGGVN